MSLTCSWVCGLVLKNIKGSVLCEYCSKWTWRKSSYQCATCNKHISYFTFLEADLSRDMTLECAQCHFGKQTAFSIQDIVGFSKRNVSSENEPNSTVYKVEKQILSKCCFYAETDNSHQFKPVECKKSVGNNEPNSTVHEEEKQVLSRNCFVTAENDNCHQFKPVKSKESVGIKELVHDKITLDNQISNQEIVLLETRPSTTRVSSTDTAYIPLIAQHCGYPTSAVTTSPVLDNLGTTPSPTLTSSTDTASTASKVTVLRFTAEHTLKWHIETIHERKCEICCRQFSQKMELESHKRVHHNGQSQKAVENSDSNDYNKEINKSNEKIPTQATKPMPSTTMVSSIDAVSPVLDRFKTRSSISLVSSTGTASIPLIAQHCEYPTSAVTISPVLDNLETKPSPTLTSSTDTASTASGLTVTPSHQSANPDLTCQECGKTFPSKSRCKTHLRVHTNERPFTCNNCNSAFKQKAHLQKHEKSCHKLETQKSMSNSDYNKSNDNSKISRTCSKCQEVFKTKKFLLDHILSDHKNGKIGQKCEFCEMTFSEKFIMDMHIDVEHEERKPTV